MMDLNSGRMPKNGSDQALRSVSRDSVLSGQGSINTLVSPHESNRLHNDTQHEQKLKIQLESML